MSPLYAGVGGVVREIKELYTGIGGVVKPMTEMWAGVNGVNRQVFRSETPVGDLAVRSIIQLNENGAPVDFYVSCHNYEQSLNGDGRTLVVRKDCYDKRAWDGGNVNAYASSDLDSWFNSTYKNMLDPDVQAAMGTTKFYYTPGNGNNTVGTLERAIFALSLTELGQSHTYANTEGSALPIANTLEVAYLNGRANNQWTRSPLTYYTDNAWGLSSDGGIDGGNCKYTRGSRPVFTLPSDFVI